MAATAALKDRVRRYRNRAMEAYWSVRRRHPSVDHAVRAYDRYSGSEGNRLAASVTFYAFLSFFPLLALAFAAVGYAAAVEPDARDYLDQALREALPGLAEGLPVDRIAEARTGAGVIGLLGLLYSGVGAVDAVRAALRRVWLNDVGDGPNFAVAKLTDVAVMAVLGVCLLGSVALTSVAQAATHWLLEFVRLQDSLVAVGTTRVLGPAIAVAVDTFIFLMVFSRLSGTRRPVRLLWQGALLAAVGFEILKAVAALLISGTLSNPIYASFAVMVGLLLWINLVMRMLLLCASWTATWLPVPPPYEGAVPSGLPIGLTGDEPARTAVRQDLGPSAATLPARPTPAQMARSHRRDRLRRISAALRRLALPAVLAAGVAGVIAWLRRRRD
ncbi:YihY/virulence factor BrkB family protein [Streptomonospora wellingtoniae]|uniref:YihY/virulence factor BrkB family protein n=1 Tax=Streptomonospora wellingtoniae TaxID=3075544 RepID=A0ABU2KZB8_9ACTN|nr:YihY/virulence factor BrkB family protein [Streptomonospora sp. DSM 45055]MDT0304602.1 YihY/virulence factor BrkB family protein [Streptomonospora sp. DSM 45055]